MLRQGLTYEALNSVQIVLIIEGGKRNRYACCSGAAGPADPVDIILGKFREVKIDDVADAGNIKPACGNISGHQQTDFPPAHVTDGPVTRPLIHIAMKRRNLMTLLEEFLGEGIGVPLGCGKDNCLGNTGIGNEMLQQPVLVTQVVGHMKPLLDVIQGGLFAGDRNPFRIVQQPLGKPGHGVIHGGGKHQCLSSGRRGCGNLVHIFGETHVQHPVGFIENQRLQTVEIDAPVFQVVDQPARSCNHDINILGEEAKLFPIGHAPQNSNAFHSHELAVGAD